MWITAFAASPYKAGHSAVLLQIILLKAYSGKFDGVYVQATKNNSVIKFYANHGFKVLDPTSTKYFKIAKGIIASPSIEMYHDCREEGLYRDLIEALTRAR